jgi:hypothetical protein
MNPELVLHPLVWLHETDSRARLAFSDLRHGTMRERTWTLTAGTKCRSSDGFHTLTKKPPRTERNSTANEVKTVFLVLIFVTSGARVR